MAKGHGMLFATIFPNRSTQSKRDLTSNGSNLARESIDLLRPPIEKSAHMVGKEECLFFHPFILLIKSYDFLPLCIKDALLLSSQEEIWCATPKTTKRHLWKICDEKELCPFDFFQVSAFSKTILGSIKCEIEKKIFGTCPNARFQGT